MQNFIATQYAGDLGLIPKNAKSYMIYQDKTFFIKDLDGNILCTYEVVKWAVYW